MSEELHYRGISYTLMQVSDLRWKWEIEPPQCVNGLRPENGLVDGTEADAALAAKKAIDLQTRCFWLNTSNPGPTPARAASPEQFESRPAGASGSAQNRP